MDKNGHLVPVPDIDKEGWEFPSFPLERTGPLPPPDMREYSATAVSSP